MKWVTIERKISLASRVSLSLMSTQQVNLRHSDAMSITSISGQEKRKPKMYKFMMKNDYEIKCWILLRKVLNFHTCFMSFSESKAKRIDKHRSSRRIRIQSQFISVHFFFLRERKKAWKETKKCVYNNCDLFSTIAFSEPSNEV